MANTNIYPYGQNQEMPAGYPIADDLDTDSAQIALSARQGKLIGEFLRTTQEIDMSTISEELAYITAAGSDSWSNVWSLGNSDYKSKLLPVEAGDEYILVGNGEKNFSYAVLASSAKTQQTTPDYATGFASVVSVNSDGRAIVTIPEDGEFLYISTYASGDCEPSVTQKLDSGLAETIKEFNGSEYQSAKMELYIAASNAPAWQKAKADYVCTGTNDELVIQRAVNALATTGGRIRLSLGVFYIDSFPNVRGGDYSNTAILLPQSSDAEFHIEGDTLRLSNGGTIFRVSDSCYEALDSTKEYCILGAGKISLQVNAKVALQLRNVSMRIPWNQKKIMCLDCLFISRVYVQMCSFVAYISGYNGKVVDLSHCVDPPIEGCVGVRSAGGTNWGTALDFKNIVCAGFYEGFKVGGEHFVGVNLSALQCHYGYTFGNYNYTGVSEHDATLINCCDERNMCGPYFAQCTYAQAVYLIGFNMETVAQYIPGGVRIQEATEQTPGQFRGRVEYTIMNSQWRNDPTKRFWESGHGHGFLSRNMTHLPACATSVRNTYAPDYLERIWDTTLGKEVICTDEANKTWKDAMGNIV